jgi:hypothetical protein
VIKGTILPQLPFSDSITGDAMLREIVLREPELLAGAAGFVLGCCVGYGLRAFISFRHREKAKRRRNIY